MNTQLSVLKYFVLIFVVKCIEIFILVNTSHSLT